MPVPILTLIAWWGGTLFLLNKYFFLRAEISPGRAKQFRIRSWQVYIIGLPAWLIVFYFKSDFIALAVEAAGFPSMLFGLLRARRDVESPSRWEERFERMSFLLLPVGIGIALSAWYFHGLTHLTQVLELLLAAGFLVGTWHLAKDQRTQGYVWYVLMNAANTALMYLQQQQVLAIQQAVSVAVVGASLVIRVRRKQLW